MSLASWKMHLYTQAQGDEHNTTSSTARRAPFAAFIPLCSAMFTDTPFVPLPIRIGLPLTPRTLNWSRMLSTPSVCRAFLTHLINPSASAFAGTSSKRYLTHDPISCTESSWVQSGPTPVHLWQYLHQWIHSCGRCKNLIWKMYWGSPGADSQRCSGWKSRQKRQSCRKSQDQPRDVLQAHAKQETYENFLWPWHSKCQTSSSCVTALRAIGK